jgi:hypothetical protein
MTKNGLSENTAALSNKSCAGYNRLGKTVRIAGAELRRVPAQIFEKTDMLSAFIGNNISVNILCCIMMNLLK